jgi:hypothetical protein
MCPVRETHLNLLHISLRDEELNENYRQKCSVMYIFLNFSTTPLLFSLGNAAVLLTYPTHKFSFQHHA